jgi:hypothetical protein
MSFIHWLTGSGVSLLPAEQDQCSLYSVLDTRISSSWLVLAQTWFQIGTKWVPYFEKAPFQAIDCRGRCSVAHHIPRCVSHVTSRHPLEFRLASIRSVIRIRLTRKLAARLNGVDVSSLKVGDVIELPDWAAQMMIAEQWAEPVDMALPSLVPPHAQPNSGR